MDDQSRNLILATALSFLVILGWFLLGPILFPDAFPPPTEATAPQAPTQTTDQPGTAPAPEPAAAAPKSRQAALAESSRVQIRTARLSGSLSLKGGRIDDLKLTDYRVTIDPDSPLVTLLNPAGAPHAYYARYGWTPWAG